MEEMGVRNREVDQALVPRACSIYGFIVMTNRREPRCRGQGQSSAVALDRTRNARWPQWQRNQLSTTRNGTARLFNGNQIWRGRGQKPKKQNPGRETTSRVDAKQRPVLDAKQRPPHPRTGRETTSISAAQPGRETTSISRLTTGGGAGGSLVKKEQGKVPWSTPILEPVPGDYDRATLANADIF